MVESDYTKILLALISSGALGYLVRTFVDVIKDIIKLKYSKETLKEKYDNLYHTLIMLTSELEAERVLIIAVNKDNSGEYLSILYEMTHSRKIKSTLQNEELPQEYRELFSQINLSKSLHIPTEELPTGFYKNITEIDAVVQTAFYVIKASETRSVYLCLHLKETTIQSPQHKELIRQSLAILKNWFKGEN